MKYTAYNLDHLQAPTVKLEDLEKKNNFKVPGSTKIFCTEDYAEELYHLMINAELPTGLIKPGDIVTGTVTGINENEITFDINEKFPVYLDISKESKSKNELKLLRIGDVVDRLYVYNVIKIGSVVSTAYVSKEKIKEKDLIDNLKETIINQDTFYDAKIVELTDGGYLVDISGVTCFMPGSLAAPNKIINFNEKIGETLKVMPVAPATKDRHMVVSHKKYIKHIIPEKIRELDLIHTEYEGTITGSTKFGIFVEFNEYLTGMIHTSEFDEETAMAHKANLYKPGDKIKFRVKEITPENKIILSQKDFTKDPWYNFAIEPPTVLEVEITGIKDYGLFVKIKDGPSGLLHVSELTQDINTFSIGDKINVVLIKVDYNEKKVYFTMKTDYFKNL